MERHPTWFDAAWLAGIDRQTVAVDTGEMAGHVHLDSDWTTDWRCLDCWLLYSIEKGVVRFETEAGSWLLNTGATVLIPAGTAFNAHNDRAPCRLGRCRLHFAERRRGCLISDRCDQLAIERLIALADDATAPLREQQAAAWFLLAWTPALRPPPADRHALDPRRRQAIESWLDRHITDQPQPADLARVLGLSTDYAARLIRATVGRPPRRWIVERRLRQIASTLLESTATIEAIADHYGYSDANLLCRQFRQHYGVSPGAYRRQATGGRSI